GERHACSPDDAREHVAPEPIGPERMGPAPALVPHRRAELEPQRLVERIGEVEERRQHGREHEDGDDAEREERQAALPARRQDARPDIGQNDGVAGRLSAHSMTWPARTSNDAGTVRPSALAVLTLMTSSKRSVSSPRVPD